MKSAVFGWGALAMLMVAGPAQAGEPKEKAKFNTPAVAPVSWTGFYAGLGLGFRASHTDATTTSQIINGNPVDFSDFVPSLPFDGAGFRTSPYLGFNWQFAPQWVAGIEGDAGFASQTTTRAGFSAAPVTGSDGTLGDGLAMKVTWDTSLRGRVGYLLTPATIAYATGGVGWQHYDLTSICVSLCAITNVSPPIVTGSTTKSGWTVGGGFETALAGHWLARAEYRYVDFGFAPFAIARSGGGDSQVENLDVKLRTHVATFGLAYKFGDAVAPYDFGVAPGALAKATSVPTSWTGFYAGLGIGARASRSDLITTSSVQVDPIDLAGLAISQPFDGVAFRASPYGGFSWQFAPQWIAGVEGDVGFANQTTTLGGFFGASPVSISNDPADSLVVKTKWDASLRGRFGFLLSPRTLAYATAGAAWQHFAVISTCGTTDPVFECADLNPKVVTSSITKAGWTAGGGFETSLWGPWLARADYRYADFGATPLRIARTFTGNLPAVDTFDVKLRTHTVTFGLAYKFN
jgi:outer membrane immunogenic protein